MLPRVMRAPSAGVVPGAEGAVGATGPTVGPTAGTSTGAAVGSTAGSAMGAAIGSSTGASLLHPKQGSEIEEAQKREQEKSCQFVSFKQINKAKFTICLAY